MNASSRCCPAVRMPPRDQDVHHRRSYRDRRGTFRTVAHPAAAGWSLPRSQGRHWRMTEQDNVDALDDCANDSRVASTVPHGLMTCSRKRVARLFFLNRARTTEKVRARG